MDKIYKLFLNLGFPPRYLGYHYFAQALQLVQRDRNLLQLATKCLYPEIAKNYRVSVCTVERNMRYFISVWWNPEHQRLLAQAAGCSMESKPAVMQFLAILSEALNRIEVE